MTDETVKGWPTKNDIDWFVEMFLADIDSWYTADIACCDACHDEFLALWPYAYTAEDNRFQRSAIDLDSFYSGSKRVQGLYTKAQFDKLIQHVPCPRCGAKLWANIWAYNLPCVVDADFEDSVREVADIAALTPFLILKHPLAVKVLEAVQHVAKSLDTIDFKKSLFRAREVGPDIRKNIACFDLPPKGVVTEGRYNHAGNPVLYLASDVSTCHEEMGKVPCLVAEIRLLISLKVLDLVNPCHSHKDDADQLSALVYSALLSAKRSTHGWHKPEYAFSRFVADCARVSGIQAIKYPSTKITGTNFNLAIVDPAFSLARCATVVGYQRVG